MLEQRGEDCSRSISGPAGDVLLVLIRCEVKLCSPVKSELSQETRDILVLGQVGSHLQVLGDSARVQVSSEQLGTIL